MMIAIDSATRREIAYVGLSLRPPCQPLDLYRIR